jgi:hypothetical protein
MPIASIVLEESQLERCHMVAFPPHPTNIFQTLDFVFFGALKKLKTPADGQINDNFGNDQITKLIQAPSRRRHRSRFEIHFLWRGWFRTHQPATSD